MNSDKLQLKLHNWRCFDFQRFELPVSSGIIVGPNGNGKTSILSAFYTLFTKSAWPTTRFIDNLKIEKPYFGVSTQFNNWYISGKLVTPARLSVKAEIPITLAIQFSQKTLFPSLFTYLPTDNYWFYQSRSAKLNILDVLVNSIFGKEFDKKQKLLAKFVAGKQKLLKKTLQEEVAPDPILLKNLNREIYFLSLEIWNYRKTFLDFIKTNLHKFSGWINSPIQNWNLVWQICDTEGQRVEFDLDIQKASTEEIEQKIDWQKLWQKELIVKKVLFGSQRDDFWLESNGLQVQSILSRGEMRLLVLFIKALGIEFLQQLQPDKPIFWLLDDIFNELDAEREYIFHHSLLTKVDYFLGSSTRKLNLDINQFSLKDLE